MAVRRMRREPKVDTAELHADRWAHCGACGLAATRRHAAPGAGVLPCALLVLGEAPGKSEDVRGVPFCGPSGRLRRQLWGAAEKLARAQAPPEYISNVLACRPCDARFGPNRAPLAEEVAACWPRLQELAVLARPDRVVFLGDVAERYGRKLWPDGTKLVHPAHILRNGGTESPMFRAAARDLAAVFEGMRGGKDGSEAQGKKPRTAGDALEALRG